MKLIVGITCNVFIKAVSYAICLDVCSQKRSTGKPHFLRHFMCIAIYGFLQWEVVMQK